MSFIMFRKKCEDCREKWSAAFGHVGMTIVADGGPKEYTKCKSARIIKIADEWQ
jgi:hypothetical protein